MGDVVLKDSSFEPSHCNAIVLTGYFQPKGHIVKRAPRSQIKLYSSGFLRDTNDDMAYKAVDDETLDNPTFVNFNGSATFSNMMLSSFADSYAPRLLPQYLDVYTSLYREKRLSLADVKMMDDVLCK